MKDTENGLVVDLAASPGSSITILTLASGEQILTTLTPEDMAVLLRSQLTEGAYHFCMNFMLRRTFSGEIALPLSIHSITTCSLKPITRSMKNTKGDRLSNLRSLMTLAKLKL